MLMDNKEMFRTSSSHTIDAKGRIIIPARFREPIKAGGEDAVMVSRMDQCLVAYPFNVWATIEQKVLSMAQMSDAMRRFRRVFIGQASDCKCDKQGRILIPPMLREYAQLVKDIVLVGVLDHFEIWSKENYEDEINRWEEDLSKDEVRNEIAQLGL